MRIAWHGHSCFEFTDGLSVVVDPHDGRSIGIMPPSVRADLVLMTHDHYDHNAARAIRGVHKDFMEKAGEFEYGGIRFLGIPTHHDESRGAKRGRNTVYRFQMEGIVFCHCGDLGHMPDDFFFHQLGKVDVLMVPTGGGFTLEIGKVMQLIERINPKIVVPMHYRVGGLSIAIDGLDSFLSHAPDDRVYHVGNVVELYADDLMEGTEYWIFSL
ncbi:MAG: MBL fold metallo-hydrolase [Candidatus Methanomethylophilaceae archaeon]|jgi:L-ascorbate metabolism protein UlaG (beta-lactamase superfamily)